MSSEGFSEPESSHSVLGPVAPQVNGFAMKAPSKQSAPNRDPITKPTVNPNTTNEDWARKMGLL